MPGGAGIPARLKRESPGDRGSGEAGGRVLTFERGEKVDAWWGEALGRAPAPLGARGVCARRGARGGAQALLQARGAVLAAPPRNSLGDPGPRGLGV